MILTLDHHGYEIRIIVSWYHEEYLPRRITGQKNVNMFASVHERYFWSGNPNGKHTHTERDKQVPMQPSKSCVTGAWFASLAVQRVVNKTLLVYHVNERHHKHIFP